MYQEFKTQNRDAILLWRILGHSKPNPLRDDQDSFGTEKPVHDADSAIILTDDDAVTFKKDCSAFKNANLLETYLNLCFSRKDYQVVEIPQK